MNWESRWLSRAAKTCLLKIVSNVIANCTMNCFRIPTSILNQIDGIQREFFGDLVHPEEVDLFA